MSERVLVSLPVDLVERLVPGRLAELQERVITVDTLGHSIAVALHEISVQAHERREALLKLLDQAAAE